jgi:DNA polymerase-3 subunit gamma/tau
MAYSDNSANDDEVLETLGAIDRQVLFDLSTALLSGDVVSALNSLDDLYNQGYDMKRLYRQMLEHFRHLVVVKMHKTTHRLVDSPAHEIALMQKQLKNISLESTSQIFTAFFEAEAAIRFSDQPRLTLEALFIKLTQFKSLVSFDHIIKGINGVADKLGGSRDSSDQDKSSEPTNKTTSPSNEDRGEILPKQVLGETPPTHPESLSQTWQKLLSVFHEQCKTLVPSLEKAMLTKAGPDFLEITIPENSFFTDRLRDKKSMARIQQACSQFFGREINIKLLEQQAIPSENADSDKTDKERQMRKEALSHPLVADALEVFKGKVVGVKIL